MSRDNMGTYTIEKGVLTLWPEGEPDCYKFYVEYLENAIKIRAYVYHNDDGSLSIAMGSFLWGNSRMKTSGVFHRKE